MDGWLDDGCLNLDCVAVLVGRTCRSSFWNLNCLLSFYRERDTEWNAEYRRIMEVQILNTCPLYWRSCFFFFFEGTLHWKLFKGGPGKSYGTCISVRVQASDRFCYVWLILTWLKGIVHAVVACSDVRHGYLIGVTFLQGFGRSVKVSHPYLMVDLSFYNVKLS